MRDGRLERFCSTLCPGSLRMPGHFCVVRMRLLLEPGQKEQKPARFLCLREPKKAGQRNLRVALGAPPPPSRPGGAGPGPPPAPRGPPRAPPGGQNNARGPPRPPPPTGGGGAPGTCPYLRRSAQRAEASGCGHEPDDFVPFEARPARRASPFELRGRAQKVRFTPRYPLPSPAGETSFYPASAIKGAKPRPLSLS